MIQDLGLQKSIFYLIIEPWFMFEDLSAVIVFSEAS